MTTADLFGPYPAARSEIDERIGIIFGDTGPARVVQMRAVRCKGACPGCNASTGSACVQSVPGGREKRRKWVHASRVAVSLPCATHEIPAGARCPTAGGVCADRDAAAHDDIQVLAEIEVRAARQWQAEERDTIAAMNAQVDDRHRPAWLDPSG